MSRRDEYVEELKAQIDEWNAEIDVLEAKARQSSAEVRNEYLEEVDGLREKRDEVEGHLREIQQAGEGVWQDLKLGADQAWNAMRHAFKRAKSRFD